MVWSEGAWTSTGINATSLFTILDGIWDAVLGIGKKKAAHEQQSGWNFFVNRGCHNRNPGRKLCKSIFAKNLFEIIFLGELTISSTWEKSC